VGDLQLYELVIAERSVDGSQDTRRHTGCSDLHHGIEPVGQPAQVPAVDARELDRLHSIVRHDRGT